MLMNFGRQDEPLTLQQKSKLLKEEKILKQ